jgi:hypothetical protein
MLRKTAAEPSAASAELAAVRKRVLDRFPTPVEGDPWRQAPRDERAGGRRPDAVTQLA